MSKGHPFRRRPAVRLARPGEPIRPGEVELTPIFTMKLNAYKTALNIWKGPDGVPMVHFADGATRTMAMGFLSRDELRDLWLALGREFAP